jgi:hypothetical protein
MPVSLMRQVWTWGAVTVAGDLGQIDCGDGNPLKTALKSLTVHSSALTARQLKTLLRIQSA